MRLAEAVKDSLGIIETRSIAIGMEAADAMVKSATVDLIMASSVCAGKYVVVVGGEVQSVRTAVEVGAKAAGQLLIDQFSLSRVHPAVFTAFVGTTVPERPGAVGIIETFSIVSAVVAADLAVKTANVELIEIRSARGLGGKCFVVMTGEVAAVQSAVRSGAAFAEENDMLVATTVIPLPHPDLMKALV